MAKLSELGGGAAGSIAIAVIYGAAFSLAYPLQPVDSSLALLFAIFGLLTYVAIRLLVKRLSKPWPQSGDAGVGNRRDGSARPGRESLPQTVRKRADMPDAAQPGSDVVTPPRAPNFARATNLATPIVFISYAHADEPETPGEGDVKWLSFVTGFLGPAMKRGAVDIWIDQLMRGGVDWDPEIEHKLRTCDIFVLLVSRHSMSSDYVVDREIAIIRERQANGEDVYFYPLLLTPTPKIGLELIRDKNLRPPDAKPFSDYPVHDQYRLMAKAADEIATIAAEIGARKSDAVPGGAAR